MTTIQNLTKHHNNDNKESKTKLHLPAWTVYTQRNWQGRWPLLCFSSPVTSAWQLLPCPSHSWSNHKTRLHTKQPKGSSKNWFYTGNASSQIRSSEQLCPLPLEYLLRIVWKFSCSHVRPAKSGDTHLSRDSIPGQCPQVPEFTIQLPTYSFSQITEQLCQLKYLTTWTFHQLDWGYLPSFSSESAKGYQDVCSTVPKDGLGWPSFDTEHQSIYQILYSSFPNVKLQRQYVSLNFNRVKQNYVDVKKMFINVFFNWRIMLLEN